MLVFSTGTGTPSRTGTGTGSCTVVTCTRTGTGTGTGIGTGTSTGSTGDGGGWGGVWGVPSFAGPYLNFITELIPLLIYILLWHCSVLLSKSSFTHGIEHCPQLLIISRFVGRRQLSTAAERFTSISENVAPCS